MIRFPFLHAGLAALIATTAPAPAEDAKAITFGMSTALTGPCADLGMHMKLGVEVALAEINRDGGINGHLVRLIAMDDGYEPSRAAPNMHTLIESDRVLAVVGNVGTPTAVVSMPIAVESKTLFFGACTGAGLLRATPPERYVINYRASYGEETGAMVDALIEQGKLKPDEIGFFTQRDAYGDAGFSGGLAALRRHGLGAEATVTHGRYERNTLSVEDGLADLMGAAHPPKAVIMVGTYAPCAKFLQLARELAFNPIFLNVSFVGSSSLLKAAGAASEGVIVTQVVPPPESDTPATRQFLAALKAFDPAAAPDFGSCEGYLSTRVLLRAMQSTKGELTRETLIDSLEGLGTFDIGLGTTLKLSPSEHQASHAVWPTIIRQGRVESFDWTQLPGVSKVATGTP